MQNVRVCPESHSPWKVSFITDLAQAEQIVATGLANAIFLARELLRNPSWPMAAARALQVDIPLPVQYLRAKR